MDFTCVIKLKSEYDSNFKLQKVAERTFNCNSLICAVIYVVYECIVAKIYCLRRCKLTYFLNQTPPLKVALINISRQVSTFFIHPNLKVWRIYVGNCILMNSSKKYCNIMCNSLHFYIILLPDEHDTLPWSRE